MGGEGHGHLPRPEAATFYSPHVARRRDIRLDPVTCYNCEALALDSKALTPTITRNHATTFPVSKAFTV
jgi:hypothetical protein